MAGFGRKDITWRGGREREEAFWKSRIKVINNGEFALRDDGITFTRNTVSAE